MNIFTRSLTDDLASLVKQMDEVIEKNKSKQMAGFLVLLTDDPDEAEAELKAFAQKHGIKNIPLTIFDGIAGPPNYRIAKEAEVTVHLWRRQKVAVNYAFDSAELGNAAIAKIVQDTETILQ